MKYKFTPRPWYAIPNNSFWEIRPQNGGEGDIPFQIGDVCASSPSDRDGGLQEANARLIASAPDLLYTLESIVEMNPELPIGMIEFAQDAIAKATGEEV